MLGVIRKLLFMSIPWMIHVIVIHIDSPFTDLNYRKCRFEALYHNYVYNKQEDELIFVSFLYFKMIWKCYVFNKSGGGGVWGTISYFYNN